jgi:hypothetical protein
MLTYSYAGAAGGELLIPWKDVTPWVYGGNLTQFTSLAGVTYPAASAAPSEQPLSLLNGWQSGQDITAAEAGPSYYSAYGLPCLDGMAINSGTTPEFSVLPQPLRPAHTLYLLDDVDNGIPAILQIQTDGEMDTYGAPPSYYTGPNETSLAASASSKAPDPRDASTTATSG